MHSPLVSIILITYNSEKYLLETLESAKNQTYKNIELIISDDLSTDNTIQIVKEWLNKNSQYFINTLIIETKYNSGIPANCNRGIRDSTGEWIKLIAGDDVLLPDAIENFVNFITGKQNCEIVHSKVIRMVHRKNKIFYNNAEQSPDTLHEKMSAETQFKLLQFSSMVKAPSVFIKKSLLEKLNYFDETIRMCEDWPFWLKTCSNGHKFYFLNRETVNYRIHERSVYSGQEHLYLIHPFYKIEKKIYHKYIRTQLGFVEKIIFDHHHFIKQIFFKFNRSSPLLLFKHLYSFLNLPFRIFAKITFLKYTK